MGGGAGEGQGRGRRKDVEVGCKHGTYVLRKRQRVQKECAELNELKYVHTK